jgi:hypothetical protein
MMTDELLDTVRKVDPIADIDVRQWSTSPDAQQLLDRIVGSNVVALRSPRRRRIVWVGAAVAVAGALATGAAASGLLGGPAPEPIRDDLAAVDRGLPEDLRANPDVEHAMAVASSANGVLYAADVRGGGYCYEIATDGDDPRGAVCVTTSQAGDRAIEVTSPIPSTATEPLIVGGRINDARVERIVARYPNGTTVDVELGLSNFWLTEVPEVARDAALGGGLKVVGLGSDGQQVAIISVPPLRDEDPDGALDRHEPIAASTVSSNDDLTLVLGVSGSVNADGAVTVELHYPDGTVAPIALAADRTFRVDVPAERQRDFAEAWGQLIARDADGNVVATDSISSVAHMRRES